jgi:YHS domain-containing protein
MSSFRLIASISMSLLLILSVLGLMAPAAQAFQDSKPPVIPEFKGDPYLLDSDPVTGATLGPIGSQVVIDHEGRELRFASQANAEAFKTEPAKYLPSIDAKLIEQQKPLYPLDACVVSAEKLGGKMGEPIDFLYKNRLIRFCCKSCKPDFLKDPAKFIAKLDAAVIAKQGPTYPATACVVSDEKLGGDMGPPVDVVVGNRLIRLCCKDCQKDFRKDPLKYLGKQHAAPEHEGDGHEPGHEHEGGHDHPKGGGGH